MDTLNFIGSIIILVEAILGILFSSFVIFVYFYKSSDRTSFNLICFSRATNNVIVLMLNFLVLEFPITLLSKNILPLRAETLIIYITVNLYLVNEFQTILIAANRFTALFFPLYYHKLFTIKITMVLLGALYIERGYSVVSKLWAYFVNDCALYWNVETFSALFMEERCLEKFPPGMDGPLIIIVPLVLFVLTIILNLMTFTKILRFYFSHNLDSESMQSIRNNIKLFVQTVLQDSLFFVDVLFTFKLSYMSTHRYWLFISTVFVWETIHMLDGLIMLMFSDRLSILKSKIGVKTSNRVSGRGVGHSDFRAVTTSMPDIG